MSQLVLSDLRKSFGDLEIIKGVNLEVSEGEFVVFVGPSGCGKSTLLRMIAGLEDVTAGEIVIGGKQVKDLPPVKRGIAMVFQSYALYPHMSVFENIAFPLRVEGLPEDKVKERVGTAAQGAAARTAACNSGPARCPAASASASPSAAPSCASRRFSCSTSRSPISTRRCAPRCASN